MTEVSRFEQQITQEAWRELSPAERAAAIRRIPLVEAEDLFLNLDAREQAELLLALPPGERRPWIRLLHPDDAADLIQEAPEEEREGLLSQLDPVTRREVTALLAYEEDEAGGLMSTWFARVRPDMTVDEAIAYLRMQSTKVETIYYAYVLDQEQRLLGVVSFRDLFAADRNKRVQDVMRTKFVYANEDMDQEQLARLGL